MKMSIKKINNILSNTNEKERANSTFWLKINKKENGCWDWALSKTEFGYGRVSLGASAKGLKTHQVAYALAYGAIPEDKNVLHHCDNRLCCNPEHLFLGTKKDNTHDMMQKGRMCAPPIHFGEKHHKAKFDKETAIKIARDLRSASKVAKDYGIHISTVYRIKNKKTWRELWS